MSISHVANRTSTSDERRAISVFKMRGFTLIEVLFAVAIIAIALVPAMVIVPGTVVMTGRVEHLSQNLFFAQGKIEETTKLLRANFITTLEASGSFTADGFPKHRFTLTTSEAAAEGGVVLKLKVIKITVWYDDNANAVLDAGTNEDKDKAKLATKVANRQ